MIGNRLITAGNRKAPVIRAEHEGDINRSPRLTWPYLESVYEPGIKDRVPNHEATVLCVTRRIKIFKSGIIVWPDRRFRRGVVDKPSGEHDIGLFSIGCAH